MKKPLIYHIPAIVPLTTMPHGQWGYPVGLDVYSAIDLRKRRLSRETVEHLQAEGRRIIKLHKIKGMFDVQNPYSFIEESRLLRGINIPGDATDLGLDDFWRDEFLGGQWRELPKFLGKQKFPPVSYVPHNVDTKDQAFCLLAVWLNWANTIQHFGE